MKDENGREWEKVFDVGCVGTLRDTESDFMVVRSPKPKKLSWPPVEGQEVWLLTCSGQVGPIKYREATWIKELLHGHLFLTEQDARDESWAQQIETQFRSQPGRKAWGEGRKEHNWGLDSLGRIILRQRTMETIMQCYFESKEAALAARDAVGWDNINRALEIRAGRVY